MGHMHASKSLDYLNASRLPARCFSQGFYGIIRSNWVGGWLGIPYAVMNPCGNVPPAWEKCHIIYCCREGGQTVEMKNAYVW